ncbi:CapA family protein [Candidatus Saccharibacteria bacterium]|nr:CapA family protein [Candidatus Saccharibacteria bacterium]
MSVIIGGDLVPYGNNTELFSIGAVEKILGRELIQKWNKSDYRFFNLECPITDSSDKIRKCGPNIKCSTKAISGIKSLNPTCIMLSNNHILDYGEQGLTDTLEILKRNNIRYVGVGKNYNSLIKTYEFLCDGKKVAIYNCCEHEFSVATNTTCGANPYEENVTVDNIKSISGKNDYVIIIYHGGKEHYRYPSPKLQKRCRDMIKAGANLVICQHSHCVGCEEKYKNGTIVYGQGNFVFNLQRNEYWNSSLLIEVDVAKNKINYIPIVQTDYGSRMANEKESKKIIDGFMNRSQEIKNADFVEMRYKKYAAKELSKYIVKVNGRKSIKIIHKFMPWLFKRVKFDYTAILNTIECESHNELFTCGLRNKIRKDKE